MDVYTSGLYTSFLKGGASFRYFGKGRGRGVNL